MENQPVRAVWRTTTSSCTARMSSSAAQHGLRGYRCGRRSQLLEPCQLLQAPAVTVGGAPTLPFSCLQCSTQLSQNGRCTLPSLVKDLSQLCRGSAAQVQGKTLQVHGVDRAHWSACGRRRLPGTGQTLQRWMGQLGPALCSACKAGEKKWRRQRTQRTNAPATPTSWLRLPQTTRQVTSIKANKGSQKKNELEASQRRKYDQQIRQKRRTSKNAQQGRPLLNNPQRQKKKKKKRNRQTQATTTGARTPSETKSLQTIAGTSEVTDCGWNLYWSQKWEDVDTLAATVLKGKKRFQHTAPCLTLPHYTNYISRE